MSARALDPAWYRFRTTFRRRWGAYVALLLLVGLIGGVAMGSIVAARRTAASYSTFLASANPSDLIIQPISAKNPNYSQRLTDAITHLKGVRHVESYVALGAELLKADGSPRRSLDNGVALVGSVDGLLFNQDRFAVTSGRMANPARANEIMVTETAARALGVHLGQTLSIGLAMGSGTPKRRVDLRIVGIGLLDREVVQDEVARFPTYIVATPALTATALSDTFFTYYGLQLVGGSHGVSRVEDEFVDAEPRYFTDFAVASEVEGEAEQAIRPEAIALGVFGGIAALAALLVALQAISRQLRSRDDELQIMRAIGAGPATTAADGLIGVFGALLLGAVLAVGVAIALSPLSPIGPARPVDPRPGIDLDWTVLGLGFAVLVLVLGSGAVVLALVRAPHRLDAERSLGAGRASAAVQLAARSGLPPSAVAGVRFALEPGRGRTAAPTRSALFGAVIAMTVVVATFTFGSGLQTLVSHPALYGWNWDYAVQSGNGYGPVPDEATRALASNPVVAAFSGVWFATLQLDGVEVPLLLTPPKAAVAPPIISGHGLDAPNQIVLGATTLAELHKRIGDTVVMRYGPVIPHLAIAALRLVIVGVATMPAIGIAEGLHTSMGIGALVASDAGPVTIAEGPDAYPGCSGFNMVFLRMRPGTVPATGAAAAQHLASTANALLSKATNDTCSGDATTLSVQRPAQIVNYRSMGDTPGLLAAGLAAGAVVALGLALASSVRRRRRDLALLKALGFTQRQLAAAVAWQASVAGAVGIVVGVPVGIALGRWLWILFARAIGAVPRPTVPVWSVVLAAIAALALANVVAALPGRSAARTPTALVLRDE